MNWNAISAVSESFAAISVVVSLVYLAIQIRLSRTESRDVSIDRLVELWSTFVGAPADNPSLAAIAAKGLDDYGQLDLEERAQLSAHMSRIMRVSEAIYMHHHDGTIDCELWDGISSALTDISNLPFFEQWWTTRRHWFGKTFRNYVDSLICSDKQTNFFGISE